MPTSIVDPLAQHRAEQIFGNRADGFIAEYHRYVNENGVAVRILSLTGPEEVDPTAAKAA